MGDGYWHTGMRGSLRYMAPEVAMSRPYNDRSEIYSLALILWEMATQEVPYSGVEADTFEQQVCLQHVRPPIPDSFRDELRSLLTASWHRDHRKRPSSSEIVPMLQNIKSLHEKLSRKAAFRRQH